LRALHGNSWFRVVAVIAPLMAIAPIVLGLHGGWIALHLIGGATALAILVIAVLVLPKPWRWYAAGGVAISIVAIAVVTSGGTIGPVVQVAMLVVLAAIYISSVFWPHDRADA
jgi:hypothetical protein